VLNSIQAPETIPFPKAAVSQISTCRQLILYLQPSPLSFSSGPKKNPKKTRAMLLRSEKEKRVKKTRPAPGFKPARKRAFNP
jgi:hypothetical protein